MAELLNITTRRLQGRLTSESKAVEKTEKKGLIKLLAQIDEDINSCRSLVSCLKDQANTCFEALTTLEAEFNQIYSAKNTSSSACYQAKEENRHMNGSLSSFVNKFRHHIGLD